MVFASHYVIKNILRVLERKDITGGTELCEKFSSRYSEDRELLDVCSEFKSYLKTRDSKKLEKIKSTLRELKDIRERETSGGTRLWLKDRRPGVMQLIRII